MSCDSFRVWTLLAPYGDRPLLPSCTRRLDELGVRLVVLDERHGLPSCDDVPRALDALRAYARTHPCDGVLVQTECGLLPGALFAAERGLPAVSPVAAYYATNRIAALRRLQAAGVPVPAFDLVSEAGEIRAFAATHGYPIVLRAVTSTLGRNVLRVPDAEAVFAALTELQARARLSPDLRRLEGLAEVLQLDLGFDPRGAFVVERCVDGDAVEVDGVCLRDPIPFGVADLRVTTDPGFYLEGHLFPSRRTPAETAAVRAVAVRAVQALGLRFAGFAVELRLGSAGPVVVEVTARLPEDDALGDGETCSDAVAWLVGAARGQVLVLDLALLHRVVPALLQLAERHQMRVWAQVEDVPPTADLAWFEAAGWGRASCILGIAPDPSDRTVD